MDDSASIVEHVRIFRVLKALPVLFVVTHRESTLLRFRSTDHRTAPSSSLFAPVDAAHPRDMACTDAEGAQALLRCEVLAQRASFVYERQSRATSRVDPRFL